MDLDRQETTDNPEVSRRQIERYRQMSNQERLEIGFRMWEFARSFITESVKNEFPGIGQVELRERVIARMRHG